METDRETNLVPCPGDVIAESNEAEFNKESVDPVNKPEICPSVTEFECENERDEFDDMPLQERIDRKTTMASQTAEGETRKEAESCNNDAIFQLLLKMNAKIDNQTREINVKFDNQALEINARFDSQNLKLDSQNQKLEQQSAEIHDIRLCMESKFEEFRREALEHRDSFEKNIERKFEENKVEMGNEVSNLSHRIETINREVKEEIAGVNESLQSNKGELDNLKKSIQDDICDKNGMRKELDGVRSQFKETENQLSKQIENVDKKSEQVKNQLDLLQVRTDKRVTEAQAEIICNVEEKIREFDEKVDVARASMTTMAHVPIAAPTHLSFAGRDDENPCVFIKDVENYFMLSGFRDERMKPRRIEQFLKGMAKEWIMTLDPAPKSMEEFKGAFFERYWDKAKQLEYRNRLISGKWNPRGGMGMQDYAISKIARLKVCEPHLSDQEIVWYLIRHFETETQDLLNSVEINDLVKFQTLLGKYDRVRRESRRIMEEKMRENNDGENHKPMGNNHGHGHGNFNNRNRQWYHNDRGGRGYWQNTDRDERFREKIKEEKPEMGYDMK